MRSAALSFGEMAGAPVKHPRKVHNEKCCCFFCDKTWLPKSGMAARNRDYCYDPICERKNEARRNEKKVTQARMKREKLAANS